MTSTNNILNNNNNNNEFYTENGLNKAQKKDRKSHGKNAANQTEDRLKKLAEQISLLPRKMQAKLADDVAVATSPGKTINTHVTKLFHNRSHTGQSAIQELLCQEYDEELLAEEDALEEVWNEACEKKQDKMWKEEKERIAEHEEVRYQVYLENRRQWDFIDEGMSHFELMCLRDDVEAYEAEMNNVEAAKTRTFSEYEHDINQPSDALDLWQKYGLTKDQRDANLIYEINCAKLADYYEDPDHANHPQYGIDLEAAIKKYEHDFDAKTLKGAEEDDANDWWMTSPEENEECEEDELNDEHCQFMDDYEALDVYQKWREEQYGRTIEGMTQELVSHRLREHADARALKKKAEANFILKFVETPHVSFVPSAVTSSSTKVNAFYFTRQCEEDEEEEDREEARDDWFQNKREEDLEDRIQEELDDRANDY